MNSRLMSLKLELWQVKEKLNRIHKSKQSHLLTEQTNILISRKKNILININQENQKG